MAQTIKIAEEIGIPCPKTFVVESLEDVEAAKALNYPIVIKPRMKVVWVDEKAIVLKVTSRNYAYNKGDLITKYKQLGAQLRGVSIPNGFFLVQEFAEGEGYGVEVLMHNLEPRAVFVHKRLREYPLTKQFFEYNSTLDRLAQYARKLVLLINYQLKKKRLFRGSWTDYYMVQASRK